jgi:hypothetical protein
MESGMERLERISNGFIEAKILLAAAELRLFDNLTGEGKTAGVAARAVGGGRREVEILLDALVAMEIVDKRGDVYRLRDDYVPQLTEASPTHYPSLLRHRNRMLRSWAFLEERITGAESPARGRSVLEGEGANEDFIRAMYAVGHERASRVAERVDLEGVRTVADVGGGPGHYLEAFASRSPELQAWLIDLPLTLSVARRLLASSPVRDRIHTLAWDVYDQPPPAGLPSFDVVFVSQLLHAESPERNRELLRRLFALVSPGGWLIVHEHVVLPGRTEPATAALFAVNMLAMTDGGRTYTEDEILSWGTEAGFAPRPGERIDDRSFLVRMRKSRDADA